MEVLEAIKTRRSIRKYKPVPLNDERLQTVLEAARWAPSWTNTQCWEFIVVKNTETKKKLAETLLMERNPATEAVKNAPIVIVACARLGLSGFYRGEPLTDKGEFFMFDVALALQNLALAAHELGLGTVHVGAFDANAVGGDRHNPVDQAGVVRNVPDQRDVAQLGLDLVQLRGVGHAIGDREELFEADLAGQLLHS